MRIGLGLLTLAASAAAAGIWYSPSSIERGLAVIAEIGSGGEAKLGDAPRTNNSAAVSDNSGTASAARFFGFGIQQPANEAPPAQAPATVAAKQPPVEASRGSWNADVVVYPGARESTAAPALTPPARVVSTLHAGPRDAQPGDLARSLQAELKRVGCYLGDVDGSWGPGSKRALRSFVEQVNSTLQTDEPDMILFTLVRGYPGTACRGTPGHLPTSTIATTRPLPPSGPPPSLALNPTSSPAPTLGPTLQPSRPALTPAVPSFAAAPAAPAGGAIEAASVNGGTRSAPFDGRMTVGAPMPAEGQRADMPEAALPPAQLPAPRAQRPRPAREAQRRERSWTGNFFNQ